MLNLRIFLLIVFVSNANESKCISLPFSPLSAPSEKAKVYDTVRQYPFNSLFVNSYDYADAQSYGTNLFFNLLKHMNEMKREQAVCKTIPLPKTVLNRKYFNAEYEFMQYKYWLPPKDHQYVVLWAQNEAYRNSLFLSYMLQGNNANFPPGWLYLYLGAAAQLHSLQSIGLNSHKSVKAIKIPFESNEVFKVNWWDNGNYQKMEKPFAIYATQPRNTDSRYVRVVDFGTGDYTNDYTGHAFISNYLYDRQRFLLNHTYDASNFMYGKQNNFNLQLGNDPNYVKLVKPELVDPTYQQNKQQLNDYYRNFLNNNQNSDTNWNILNNPNINSNYRERDPNFHTQHNPNAPVRIDPIQLNYPSSQNTNFKMKRKKRSEPHPVYNDKAFILYNFQKDRFKESNIDPSQYSLNELAQNKLTQNQYFLNQNQQNPNADNYNLLPNPNSPNQFLLHQTLTHSKNPNQYPLPRPHYFADLSSLKTSQVNKHESVAQMSNFLSVHKNSVPITSWDPLLDNQRVDMNRVSDRNNPLTFDKWYVNAIEKNIDLDMYKYSNENPLFYKNVTYVDSYRYAKVWWNNESYFTNNKQDFSFKMLPDGSNYKFLGAKYENGVSWTEPYFWCVDPTHWIATAKSPIWATNDFHYKNRIFESKEQYRFVGLSEVVLNYEELDVNQCPGDRDLNAFASTALCDSTSQCLPLANYGLQSGGYECQCLSEYHYPFDFQGPYLGKQIDYNPNIYPLCHKSEGLMQYPNWISKNAVDFIVPPSSVGTLPIDGPIFDQHFLKKREISLRMNQARRKRFIDKRNNFEKLKDSIYENQDDLQRKCAMNPFRDIQFLNEDDERFILNLRFHANEVFKPQMAQALRIAHLLSAYLQLHSPFGASSIYSQQNPFGNMNNFKENLRTDPQLEEHYLIGEAITTLISNYPIQEVHIFFNGTEFERQKFFSTQVNLGIGISAIRSDIELILNKTTDGSHVHKSWYWDASNRFLYGANKAVFGGTYQFDDERKFYQNSGPFDANAFRNSFKFDKYGIEMNLRRSFDGLQGNVDLPGKFYDAASSGVWFGPYYDCQKRYMKTKHTLRMSFSVPIITAQNKLPVGFVSVVVGSDLKWWKINPCDTSRNRNMFQGLHRCDRETTVCQYQDIPDYENGYHLASYKCVCKPNYEFPFMDYGSSYFEGATMEKEYEKKIKGLPNVYDRLTCRPVFKQNKVRHSSSYYWNSAPKDQYVFRETFFLLFSLLLVFFIQ